MKAVSSRKKQYSRSYRNKLQKNHTSFSPQDGREEDENHQKIDDGFFDVKDDADLHNMMTLPVDKVIPAKFLQRDSADADDEGAAGPLGNIMGQKKQGKKKKAVAKKPKHEPIQGPKDKRFRTDVYEGFVWSWSLVNVLFDLEDILGVPNLTTGELSSDENLQKNLISNNLGSPRTEMHAFCLSITSA